MSREDLERSGCELLRSLNDNQLIYIMAFAEKMFAKS